MIFQEKSAQVVITLLSQTAAPTENLVPWQSLFCSILQATRVTQSSRIFLDIFNRQKFYFQWLKKESSFNTSRKYSLHFYWFCAGVYTRNSTAQPQSAAGDIYQDFYFFLSRTTLFCPSVNFFFFFKASSTVKSSKVRSFYNTLENVWHMPSGWAYGKNVIRKKKVCWFQKKLVTAFLIKLDAGKSDT